MSGLELTVFLAYLALGPLAWGALGLASLIGRRRMRRLFRPAPPVPPETAPRVTVLVPAKDEGERVRVCLDSVLAQDYPNFSVITIDDRSTDDTGRILDAIAAAAAPGKVRSLHIEQGSLPPGWLGKCHALHVAAREADGEWLMFVDSDVRLQPDAVRASVALSVSRDYHALSLMASLECHTFLERLVLPLAAFAWSVMYAISVTNNENRPQAFANGQFFLIRRSAYETVGGHESVRDQITEDVELAWLLKHQGFRVRLVLGTQFVSTRMHATLPQMLRGWGRIYSGTSRRSPWRIIWAALFLILSCFTGYVALAWGLSVATRQGWDAAGPWLIASLIHLGQMMGTLADVYRESGNRRRYALLFPLGGTILLAIMAFAIRWCITGRIEWRGTVFQQPDRSPPLAR
jgi:cellulose synthase/poly-beta-1,6-N-acetylglucosamine synthase-like glycosyltransferase